MFKYELMVLINCYEKIHSKEMYHLFVHSKVLFVVVLYGIIDFVKELINLLLIILRISR